MIVIDINNILKRVSRSFDQQKGGDEILKHSGHAIVASNSLTENIWTNLLYKLSKNQFAADLRSSPLHLNLNPTIPRVNEMIFFIDSSVTNNISQAYSNITQRFLVKHVKRYYYLIT